MAFGSLAVKFAAATAACSAGTLVSAFPALSCGASGSAVSAGACQYVRFTFAADDLHLWCDIFLFHFLDLPFFCFLYCAELLMLTSR